MIMTGQQIIAMVREFSPMQKWELWFIDRSRTDADVLCSHTHKIRCIDHSNECVCLCRARQLYQVVVQILHLNVLA
jgi:hypothetical protein